MGGTLTIAIIQTKAPKRTGLGPARTPQLRAVARIQQKAKLGALQPSDEVEGLTFSVKWEPAAGALGIPLTPAEIQQPVDILQIVSNP
jgi:mediator of RNA polymerase II transcription subunit 14